MRLNTHFFALALCTWCFAALPSHAADNPRAYLETVRWQVWSGGQTPPENPSQGVVVCQIVEAPDPIGIVCSPLSESEKVGSSLEFLLDLVATLDRALHESVATQQNGTALTSPLP